MLGAGPAMCKSTTGNRIVARHPQIFIKHDTVAGITLLVFVF
jgi:hypothetical protein